jgi:spore coat polysaccharide biosynthesis protein SpsF
MRIIGTIEARMGSSRLPGKTLTEIYQGEVLLGLVVKRFRQCKEIGDVCVATTDSHQDDVITNWCEKNNVCCYRGSENDVLDRVVKTALSAKADVIVQMGADSAYLDFDLIDALVKTYKQGCYDYVCNDLELTYPLGIYGHVVRVSALSELNARSDLTAEDREDVVRYLWEHPEEYALLNVPASLGLRCPELRLTIDYPEDMEQAMAVYAHFGNCLFTTADILKLYKEMPGIFEKTKNLIQRSAPFLKKEQH